MKARPLQAVPRLALTVEEAAGCVGVSESTFRRYVMPQIKAVREGSLWLVPVREIERYLEREAQRPSMGDVA
jgi:excisionase family DNA binding protein